MLTRDQLLERVWGYTFAGDTRTVDVHVRQLRRKLGEASPIVTVWGVGYKVGARARRGQRLAAGAAMFRSLRFRLPALFLVGIALAGLVATAIALRALPELRPRSSRSSELRREANGLTAALRSSRRSSERRRRRRTAVRAARSSRRRPGDRLFYVGVAVFPGQASGLRQLPPGLGRLADPGEQR